MNRKRHVTRGRDQTPETTAAPKQHRGHHTPQAQHERQQRVLTQGKSASVCQRKDWLTRAGRIREMRLCMRAASRLPWCRPIRDRRSGRALPMVWSMSLRTSRSCRQRAGSAISALPQECLCVPRTAQTLRCQILMDHGYLALICVQSSSYRRDFFPRSCTNCSLAMISGGG